MTTISIPGFIHATPANDWESGADVVDGQRLHFMTHEDMSEHGYINICPHTLVFTMPEGWDPRAQQIEALKVRKNALTREFSEAVMRIDEQIGKLLALEFTTEAA